MSQISGPLLDRIDLHVEVPAVPYKEMRASGAGESCAAIRERMLRARAVQPSRGLDNPQIPDGEVARYFFANDSSDSAPGRGFHSSE